jgi:hypothetical protein
MLEILGIIFLVRKVKTLMESKGYKATPYQWKAVGVWIGVEMVAAMVFVLFISPDLYTASLSAILVGAGAGLAYYNSLKKIPNKDTHNDWIDNIGNPNY